MNHAQSISDASGSPALALLLLIVAAVWCWFGRGPLCLRWPLVVLIILMTSGHQLGGMIGVCLGELAPPLLTLAIVFAGLGMMLRAVFGPWRPRYHRYGRWDHHGRW